MTAVQAKPDAGADDDQPRLLRSSLTTGDRVFRAICTSAAALSLVIITGTALFLLAKSIPAVRSSGVWDFFTTSVWNPSQEEFGVLGLLIGTVIIALIALVVAVPLALGLALFINEYAPLRARKVLTGAVDLLAALPSLIFGIWGLFALQGPLVGVAKWLNEHLDALPIFRLSEEGAALTQSSFVAGMVVAIMITPIITSVSRDVMAQCPRNQCEGALALGGSKWGMIRNVILPFGRGGIVGSVLLGFGRALGETIAIALIVVLTIKANPFVLEEGGGSIAGMIAVKFAEADGTEVSGLIAAGFALFVVTLLVNLGARRIVNRSRLT
jgi:phosphate transport system permease protein